ncbi:tyrosine-type recombinase/integrase [Cyanobacteria bacterium FACHB-63]|nr:tyrosine-type recombinase/integrase [Cyanobacteria bacterium FACHB-63]
MQAKKQPKDRNRKGSVAIIVSKDWLQLRFSYAGKRHYISLGLTDTSTNRRIAEAKAKQIESDIIYERFDPTLERYKPQTALSVATASTPICTPIPTPPKTCLAELWDKYTEFQREHLEKSTIVRDYGKIEKRIAKFPKPFLEDAIAIQSHLLSQYAAETAKRTLKQLSACCEWGIRKKLVSENPFRELAAEIKTKHRRASRVSRKPFSRECVAAIIAAFENDTYSSKFAPVPHSFYAPYVKFLLHTGCRPEEAIALKWKHIEKNRIYFCDAMPTDVRIRKDTKTHAPRYFPINEELRNLFETIRPEGCHPEMLVFPGKNGKEMHTHNFLNRVWKSIVERLVQEGKVRQYLPQYNCRHTFITLCLESGVPSRRVADWCGTSVAVIEEHYAGAIAHIQVPSFGLDGTDTSED